jgi:D-alanyl-D-alanine carboxypeptidase (penicillin-binding protein 5/6)
LKAVLRILALLFLFAAGAVAPVRAEPFATAAPVALLIDLSSGMVLLDKAGKQSIEPAAMAKMATIAVVADALQAGETTLDTEYLVSENAWRTGGAPSGSATMFAALKSRIRVADLLRGAIVQAANDACLILAEGLAGREQAFVDRMNKLAARLQLGTTKFSNVTGFADPQQKTSARDLAKVARYLIEKHPEVYAIYSEPEFTWNKIRQLNRNPLLTTVPGADGISTGASEGGSFGLVASAIRDGRRLLLVMQGLDSSKERAEEAQKLMEWGFSSFAEKQLFAEGEIIGEARVFGGSRWSVPVVAAGPVKVPVRTDAPDKLEARILYDGPIPAPIAAGAPIGRLAIFRDGVPALEVPLMAKIDIDRGGLTSRAMGALYEMTIGLVRAPVRPQ